ncbi:hypothetical protein AAC387_Pa02g1998 [Persea americana]
MAQFDHAGGSKRACLFAPSISPSRAFRRYIIMANRAGGSKVRASTRQACPQEPPFRKAQIVSSADIPRGQPLQRDPLYRTRCGRRTSSRRRNDGHGADGAKNCGPSIENGPFWPRRRLETGLPVCPVDQPVPSFPTIYHNGESGGRIES